MVFAIVVLITTAAFLVAHEISLREAERRRLADLDRLQSAHAGERERLAARVQYLEFQLANHVAHVLHLPPPGPPIENGPKPARLPDMMLKFLEAIEGDEERVEYEQGFRADLALGIDPAVIVSRALSAHA
ncbi:MAG: hypothetical protein ACRDHY_18555 [Anaerolineales bacterium]